jgi:3-ketoacyl-CoA synthase
LALVAIPVQPTRTADPAARRLIPNCLFRVGGAAVLLSNKRAEGWRAKYELQHVVRTNLAANDAAYNCVYEGEDEDGTRGVRLSKELMAIAGE